MYEFSATVSKWVEQQTEDGISPIKMFEACSLYALHLPSLLLQPLLKK